MTVPSHSKARLCVMMSGGGRTLMNLLSHCRAGTIPADIALVIAGRESTGAQRAREQGVPVEIIPGRIPQPRLEALLTAHAIDWVVLAGYLQVVEIPPAFAGRVVNIHPALLPKFGGKGMYGRRVHEAVLEAGESVSGCTIHLADEEYDRGRIILQRSCPVYETDTPETLGARVFELELEAYPAALRGLIEGTQC